MARQTWRDRVAPMIAATIAEVGTGDLVATRRALREARPPWVIGWILRVWREETNRQLGTSPSRRTNRKRDERRGQNFIWEREAWLMTSQEIKIGQVWRPMVPPLDTGAPRETFSGSDRFVLSVREETRVAFDEETRSSIEFPQRRVYWTRSKKVKDCWESIVRASVLAPEKIPASATPGTAVWENGFREWIDAYKAELVDDWLHGRSDLPIEVFHNGERWRIVGTDSGGVIAVLIEEASSDD